MHFLKKIFEKIVKKKSIEVKETAVLQTGGQESKEDSGAVKAEEKKELTDEEIIAELNSIAPGIFSQARTPQMQKMVIKVYKKMKEEGVNINDEKEVEKWLKKNSHLLNEDLPRIETYRRNTPKVGRNDPCPCGSGKKYKKCCGKNA